MSQIEFLNILLFWHNEFINDGLDPYLLSERVLSTVWTVYDPTNREAEG